MSLDIRKREGINLGKFAKKATSIALAATVTMGASSCADSGTKTADNHQNSLSIKAGNDSELTGELIDSLYESYGFMDLAAGNFDLDYLDCFTENQKKALNDCKNAILRYLGSQNEKDAKNALNDADKAIKNFYGDKGKLEVMQGILSHYLPEGIKMSDDNDHFEDKNGEVRSISVLTHGINGNDGIGSNTYDFYKLYMFMCSGSVTDIVGINGSIYNINTLLQICVKNYFEPLQVFKGKNGDYLGNSSMMAELLFEDNAFDILNNEGIFDGFDVVARDDEILDVRNYGKYFYPIFCSEEDDAVKYIMQYLEDGKITNKSLKDNGVLAPLLIKLVSTKYDIEITYEEVPDIPYEAVNIPYQVLDDSYKVMKYTKI